MKHYIRATQSNKQDSLGNPLTPEQVAFFKDSKIRDSQGRLLVCYHGTRKAGFEEFLPQDIVDSLYYKFGKNNVNCFTTEKQNAMGYSGVMWKRLPDGSKVEIEPYDFVPNEYGKKSGIYAVYLDIKNPLIIDPDDSLYDKDSLYDSRDWKNIKREGAPKRVRIEKFFDKYKEYEYDYISEVLDYNIGFEDDLKRIGISITPEDDEGYEYEFKQLSNNNDLWSDPNGAPLTIASRMGDLLDELEELFVDYQTEPYYEKESTNDIIIETLLDHPEYDGIIFKDIIDSADMFGMVTQTTIVTLKGSNQIKSINNKKPTSNDNINASNTLRRDKMKRYIRSNTNLDKTPIQMLNYLLGFNDYTSLIEESYHDGCNFRIQRGISRLDDAFLTKYKTKLKAIGAKRIYPRTSWGRIDFYIDEAKLKAQYDAAIEEARRKKAEADARLMEKLNAIDIDKYRPDNAIIKKLMDYRDRGSKVNVKAIKSDDKLLTYYYGAKMIGWDELSSDIYDVFYRRGWTNWEATYKDILQAIDRRVSNEDQYKDTRSEMDQKNGIKNSGNLFTFEDKNCWLPKSILNFLIDNNVPVHFGKRTSGAHYDNNGRQWSEIEHLTLFPDSDNPINYDIVVHTDEGMGPTTYTGNGTDERVSAKKVIEDLEYKLRNR